MNIAEIIVARHRNGPTHPGVELVFRKELAKFENAGTWGTTQPQSALAARSV